jgi:hypothetical protein
VTRHFAVYYLSNEDVTITAAEAGGKMDNYLGFLGSLSNSNFFIASRFPNFRTATRAAICSLRGRVLPASQL